MSLYFYVVSFIQILMGGISYTALTTFYNVALNPELAKQFRIAITKELLDFFMSKADDAGSCILAKFVRSCLYMLLSRSEMNQVSVTSKEAHMLALCLKGRDPFFGGYDNLITTVGNLALVPKNRKIFLDADIIGILKELALQNASPAPNGIFYAFLNMISSSDTQSEEFAHTDSAIRALLVSDSSFMMLLCGSKEEICRGLNLLLCPSDPEKTGVYMRN